MQRRDGRCQTQTKPRAGLGAAGLQADETFDSTLAVGLRDARPVICHAEKNIVPSRWASIRMSGDFLRRRDAEQPAGRI
jgi:hypothetical protein